MNVSVVFETFLEVEVIPPTRYLVCGITLGVTLTQRSNYG